MQHKQSWERFIQNNDSGDLQDLRKDLILEIAAGAFAIAWIFMISAIGYNGNRLNLFVALLLFISSLCSIWLRNRSFPFALYILLGGMISSIACHKLLIPGSLAQFFWSIPVVVSALLVSNLSVFVIAVIVNVVSLIVTRVLGVALLDPIQVLAPTLLIYLTAFASWLSSRQIHSAMGWMQSSYSQAREWLEQLRDERMAQARTIKILEEAYTRIERLNYLFQEARMAAEEARRLKAEFAANISHELRTPLNLIIGFSETMANAPETYDGVRWSPALRGDVEEIYRSSQHLLSLIDDILDLSALEVRRLGLNLEEARLGQVVDEAAAVVRGLYQAKRLYLKVDTQPDIPPVLIDATRIRQVLINLLSNASRFTTTGGVTITTRIVEDVVLIAVCDTGIGIAPKDVPKVFEEFGQVDGSLTRAYGGTGLGVPLSKRLIEMHGGEMWLESKIGTGTTFYFTLPLIYAPVKGEGTWKSPELPAAPLTKKVFRKSVLVIEPDPLLLRAMRRQISDHDLIQVTEVQTLPGLIQMHQPVALIVDQEFINLSTFHENWLSKVPPDLPVVRMSLMGSLLVAQELGIQGYLVKPVSRDQLLDLIADIPGEIRRILIVDNDLQLLELFARMLESAGGVYEPVKVASGEDALQVMREHPVDLVLLDVILPEMSGMDVLRVMKQTAALAQVPVIMVTGQYPEGLVPANPLSVSLYRENQASLSETINYLDGILKSLPKEHLQPVGGVPESPEA